MRKVEWNTDDGEGWDSACGRYRIVRCDDWFGPGYFYVLCWMGSFGETHRRGYNTLGDAKRAAAMRARATEVAA